MAEESSAPRESLAALADLVGRIVVLDVVSPYVYIGRLTGCDSRYAILEDADVHDLRDTSTTRERYVVDTRQHGIRANRTRVLVRLDQIVSLSALDDVIV